MLAIRPTDSEPKVETKGNVVVFTFTNGRTRTEGNMIDWQLARVTDDVQGRHLLLDCTKMTYINSDELGTLICLHHRMKRAGGRLTLFNLGSDVYGVFKLTKLDTLLEICREEPFVCAGVCAGDGAELREALTSQNR